MTHDLDTRQESGAIMGAVSGAMAEQYRREIGSRTRRGLEGLARQGRPAGGRAYGYVPAAFSSTGRIEIEPEQAAIVREIFDLYAGGWSPRAIAAELNRRGIPSPGSLWKRSQRRQSGWMTSAIAGDPSRGIGILNNETYVGRQVWNRLRWVRSASDSHKRRSVLNPRSEWIVRDDPRLQIVPEQVWDAVKARQADAAHVRGDPYPESGGTDSKVYRAAGIPTFANSRLFSEVSQIYAHGLNERLPVAACYQRWSVWPGSYANCRCALSWPIPAGLDPA